MSTTATREQIEARVFEALEGFGAEPGQISADAEFEALDIDSLDLVELAQIVEDEYGVPSEFEPKEHLSVKEVRRADRFTQLALAAAGEALEDAGWDGAPPG